MRLPLILSLLLFPTYAFSQTATSGSVAGSNSMSQAGAAIMQDQTNRSVSVSNNSVPRQAPSMGAPGLAAAAIETCLGSISIGASGPGAGLSFGTTVPDENCNARLNARALQALGHGNAGLVLLCQNDPNIANALAATGYVCPSPPRQRTQDAGLFGFGQQQPVYQQQASVDPYFYDSKGRKYAERNFPNAKAAKAAGAIRSREGNWVIRVP